MVELFVKTEPQIDLNRDRIVFFKASTECVFLLWVFVFLLINSETSVENDDALAN